MVNDMTNLAANISMMFTELPFRDRIAAAAQSGFRGLECVEPYAIPAEEWAALLREHGLTLALFNFPPGDWGAGERGIAADPARVDECRAGVELGLRYARATGCSGIHLMAGIMPPDADRAAWHATLIDNLRFAADAAAEHEIDVLLEPINTRVDIPNYFYDTVEQVMAVIKEAGRPNVRLQYDIYHQQIMQGDLARTIERLLPMIGHIQIADNPGRNEPGTGEIAFDWLLGRIGALGYDGWIGCEYRPAGDTWDGLGWAQAYLDKGAGK